ncbi:MAG: response regulator [Velocimicrobium sp.]
MRILIVEDEIKIRVGMGKLISAETDNEVVGEAKNGLEGLDMIRRFKPDLVITDIKMPEMDGLEMLTQVKIDNMQVHAIILTGYSEFEYARRALTLGVKDYLLKPIGVHELTKMLTDMSERIKEENQNKGTPEGFLRDIYLNGTIRARDSFEKLRTLCEKAGYQYFSLYMGYVAEGVPSYGLIFSEYMEQLLEKYEEKQCIISYVGKFQEIICLVMEQERACDLEERFSKKILKQHYNYNYPVAWSMTCFEHFENMEEAIIKIQKLQSFSIIIEEGKLVTEEEIHGLQIEEYHFPKEMEGKFKSSICNGNDSMVWSNTNEFMNYMRTHCFMPDQVKQAYIKLYSFISNLLQEIDIKSYEQLSNLFVLKKMSEARTRTELEKRLTEAITLILRTQQKKEDISNYTIKRAINYIREHYREGITLEEVARKLEITPEYLSTLFNREMNINYSTFLKQFRISHAKRLLKGTDMKVYVIANEIGYSDPKYFIRVFKEVEGVSPKEYRQQQ